MSAHRRIALHIFAIAVSASFVVAACGGDDVGSNRPPSVVAQLPAAPADPGFVDSAPVQASVPAFVDNAATSQRGDARYATMSTNAGVRVLNGFRALWQPLTDVVDAGTSAPAAGGFPSGHSAEGMRDALAMAYVIPERFQEMISRGLELGENRILAGMHSPLDVIGGRILAQAVVAANLVDPANATLKQTAFQQAHATLYSLTHTTRATFPAAAHAGTASSDRFADPAANRANYARRLTFGFAPIGTTTNGAVVPKGAEVLLETRLPYLSADQRRVVLKTTALASGYPLLDDADGWGRLNLFAAADGYNATALYGASGVSVRIDK